jgi:N utilization substance protein B
LYHIETPYKVVVNEYINLAKKFGAEQAHKFVNGVLDKLALDIRSLESRAQRNNSTQA